MTKKYWQTSKNKKTNKKKQKQTKSKQQPGCSRSIFRPQNKGPKSQTRSEIKSAPACSGYFKNTIRSESIVTPIWRFLKLNQSVHAVILTDFFNWLNKQNSTVLSKHAEDAQRAGTSFSSQVTLYGTWAKRKRRLLYRIRHSNQSTL